MLLEWDLYSKLNNLFSEGPNVVALFKKALSIFQGFWIFRENALNPLQVGAGPHVRLTGDVTGWQDDHQFSGKFWKTRLSKGLQRNLFAKKLGWNYQFLSVIKLNSNLAYSEKNLLVPVVWIRISFTKTKLPPNRRVVWLESSSISKSKTSKAPLQQEVDCRDFLSFRISNRNWKWLSTWWERSTESPIWCLRVLPCCRGERTCKNCHQFSTEKMKYDVFTCFNFN
jgi:hypothetical protein